MADSFRKPDTNPEETREWLDSLQAVVDFSGRDRAAELLSTLFSRAEAQGLLKRESLNTPYVNTFQEDLPYPGDFALEHRIRSTLRWNALMMVARANAEDSSIGGHLSTPASILNLYEVGFHHFFQGGKLGDLVYFQGHSSPAIYSRAFLEGRLKRTDLERYRQEALGRGLSSYPHPHLMPDFWQFPTVSLGLSASQAVYQARFMRYLQNRNLAPQSGRRVWAFLGDGEMEEHQSLGPLWVAGREKLDNLTFVVNCNLQRLDGPVMGNDKVVNRLESLFKGAGWNVIKLLWDNNWDRLFKKDTEGVLARFLGEMPDGDVQSMRALGPSFIRKVFARDSQVARLIEDWSDEDLKTLKRGGHDEPKIYTAYQAAVSHKGAPSVILAQTVKGYGISSAAGLNTAHSHKKLEKAELLSLRDALEIPLSDEEVHAYSFYHPGENSEEARYVRAHREALGGFLPKREVSKAIEVAPAREALAAFYEPNERPSSTTMSFVKLLTFLLKDEQFGKRIVPIVPDEARTFGMEGLFPLIKIYAAFGPKYIPYDHDKLLGYAESQDGQLLQEGITEEGAVSSWIAAATASENYDKPLIPFYIYYSMFGFQRIGDFLWAAGDIGARGFLLGATSGRTTLAGEGLQHDDGQSPLLASVNPACRAYDPAFGYEVAEIIRGGFQAMYQEGERCFYYLTLYNENYAHPEAPKDAESLAGILKGMYRFQAAKNPKIHLLSSGSIFKEAWASVTLLEKYGIEADLFSATSFNELAREGAETQRRNHLLGTHAPSYAQKTLGETQIPVLAVTDYVRAYPAQIAPYIQNPLLTLGTDGFGRSDRRAALRAFFEVDARSIAFYALAFLAEEGKLSQDVVERARVDLGINSSKPYSLYD